MRRTDESLATRDVNDHTTVAARRRDFTRHPTRPRRAKETIMAALLVIFAFVGFLALLNIIEFGSLD